MQWNYFSKVKKICKAKKYVENLLKCYLNKIVEDKKQNKAGIK